MNKNIKDDYINVLLEKSPGTVETVDRVFRQAESYEELLNKDICNWSYNDILGFYRSLALRSGSTVYNFNSLLRKYTNYCLSRNLVNDCVNHFDEISDDVIYKSCVNATDTENRILTKQEIHSLVNSTFKNAFEKYLVLAAFEGICGYCKEELINIHREDISTFVVDGKTINTIKLCSGRELSISDKLKNAILDSCEEYSYTIEDINGTGWTTKRFSPYDKGAYKRSVNSTSEDDTPKQAAHIINLRLLAMSRRYEQKMNFKCLLDSGKIHMAKELMQEKKITFDEALRDSALVYRYGKTTSIKQFKLRYSNVIGE